MMNESRFTALAEQYMDMVYRIALNALGSAADAEDVVQNVMLRLYRSDPDFESEEHARRWLIRVAVSERHHLRRCLILQTAQTAFSRAFS